MARFVESEDGEPFALLLEIDEGVYLVPPIIVNAQGRVLEGRPVSAPVPVVKVDSPADMAGVDQRLAELSHRLGVPIGPPDEAPPRQRPLRMTG